MNEECLLRKAPLTYLKADMLMECEICHKKENSKTLRGQYSGRNGRLHPKLCGNLQQGVE